MTVSYQYKVTSSTSGGFTRLLFMWKGSLYKLIYRELGIFWGIFAFLSALYRNVLNNSQKETFEKLVDYCDTFVTLIPLTFILGFYVAYVATRWWQQYTSIPWPDKAMHNIALYVLGVDEKSRIIRRTLMRYLNLTLVLVLRSISSSVKRRFPTMEDVVDMGFMTKAELRLFESVPNKEFNTFWVPCAWFVNVLKRLKEDDPKFDSSGLKMIMEEFGDFRAKCGTLKSFDWISIPLVYTQVVTLATYSFFIAALVGRQYVENSKKPQIELDIYVPIFTMLQFLFFMGLLKVAEELINPFGDDDEDFELNWLIDRHMKVSYLGVDTLTLIHPPLEKDKYFDSSDITLPYTEASCEFERRTYRGPVHSLHIPERQQSSFVPENREKDNMGVYSGRKSSYVTSHKENRLKKDATWKDEEQADDDGIFQNGPKYAKRRREIELDLKRKQITPSMDNAQNDQLGSCDRRRISTSQSLNRMLHRKVSSGSGESKGIKRKPSNGYCNFAYVNEGQFELRDCKSEEEMKEQMANSLV